MNPSTTELTLNMQLPNIAAVSWAVQGDQLARKIKATLVDGSAAWTPQTGYNAVVRYHKPDGTNGVYDVDEDGNPAVSWAGNVATITIAQQALTVPGTVLMQLEFYDDTSARITAFGWANNVQPSAVTDTEFMSTDYYNLLTLQIAGVLGATSHPPYINSTNKNWMTWDENTAAYIDSGFSSIGITGPAPLVTGTIYQYANSTSGTVVPSSWSDTRPATTPGTWAWTKTVITYNTGNTTTLYSAAYQGQDGEGAPGTAAPKMDGTAAVGISMKYSREDHVHPTDISRQTKKLSFENKAVTSWADDPENLFPDFPMRGTIACAGVSSTMFPVVVFDAADAISGDFAPNSKCGSGAVYVYAVSEPDSQVTVKSVVVFP
jgi:hypothetical protein